MYVLQAYWHAVWYASILLTSLCRGYKSYKVMTMVVVVASGERQCGHCAGERRGFVAMSFDDLLTLAYIPSFDWSCFPHGSFCTVQDF